MSIRRIPYLLLTAILTVGGRWAGAEGTGHLFVSSEKDHAVYVLDGQTHEAVKTIRTAARPRHLQFNPTRTLIYVACGDGNAIDIIDVEKLELVDRIGPIDDPERFDLSPDGNVMYISLEDDGALGILELDTYFGERGTMPELTVAEVSTTDDDVGRDGDEDEADENEDAALLPGMSTVEVGAEPEGILVSPDGRFAYVTSEVANLVHVVDTESREMTANILVGNRPRRFALTPDGGELWVTNELSGSVSIIDPKSNEVVDMIEFLPPGFRPEDVTPVGVTLTNDGSQAIVALGRANHVAFVDVASREIEDYVLVGNRAWNAVLTRDNATLYVANGLSDDVSVIDVAGRKTTKSIPVGRVPYAILIDD